ncbi:type VII secretion protein EccB [Corynebacterium lubricantis]|uniref:type VII secretion protein EccB n=1 Tax=Corynebacterium lubricantis TaxID=541095 RepID=UPI00052645A4|nr:type VII secretion protein EccB [Corynebacterium lubricantis]
MAGKLLPTTRAQVSGHKFLRRRVEHGLVFGDIRMIHDPLASRQRAGILGMVAVALIAAVAGLLAWLQPNSDPGDAPVVRSEQGSLFVRIDDRLHPVANLSSARLIVDEPVQPVTIGTEKLAEAVQGVPVGIAVAPNDFAPAPEDTTPGGWAVCHEGESVSVIVGASVQSLDDDAAVVARVGQTEWLATAERRTQLPPSDTPDGRAIRRVLGISEQTPRWEPPAEVLSVLEEGQPIRLPQPLPEVLSVAEADPWVRHASGGIAPITATQKEMLLAAGAPARNITRAELNAYPDAADPAALSLPAQASEFLDPSEQPLCATDSHALATLTQPDALRESVELSGESVATHFKGLPAGAVGVDTGHSYHVVSPVGQHHEVEQPEALQSLGVNRVDEAPWAIIRLLPEGAALSREAALKSTY